MVSVVRGKHGVNESGPKWDEDNLQIGKSGNTRICQSIINHGLLGRKMVVGRAEVASMWERYV